jgi:hypothetical protein
MCSHGARERDKNPFRVPVPTHDRVLLWTTLKSTLASYGEDIFQLIYSVDDPKADLGRLLSAYSSLPNRATAHDFGKHEHLIPRQANGASHRKFP